jgi:hypothetical protein
MHLSPAARESAIALFNRRVQGSDFGPQPQKPREIVVEAPGIEF